MRHFTKSPILISGAGIAGLSSAIALSQKGYSSIILEQSDRFLEIGAGIQLGPNGMKVLSQLNVEADLKNIAFEPGGIKIVHGITGKCLAKIPLKPIAQNLFQAPYYTIHRADLQKILLNKVSADDNIEIKTNFRVSKFHELETNEICVSSTDDRNIAGSLLIGADGVWSQVRQQIHPNNVPTFSGKTAWRALIPQSLLKSFPDVDHVHLYMGPNCHLIHYPVGDGSLINVVAVISEHHKTQSWDTRDTPEKLFAAFKKWIPDTQSFLQHIENWSKWPLYEYSTPMQWSKNRCVLIGDAIHPTLPFLAQGAAMALEDSVVLADLIFAEDHYPTAFKRFEDMRYNRVKKIQTTSKKLGHVYHLDGLLARGRNFVISNRSSLSMLKDYTWLYGYDSFDV